jgi:4-diphosphocytidyl-2-C-methyl-D-erythritol kinase
VAGLARSRQHALAIGAMITAAEVADVVVTASGPAPGAVLLER